MTKEKYYQNIDEYNKNPNYCLHCGNAILCSYEDKIYLVKQKKFCNSSCAASYHNKGVRRNYLSKNLLDNFTDEEIIDMYQDSSSIHDFSQKLGYKERINLKSKNVKERLDRLNIDLEKLKSMKKSNSVFCIKCGSKLSRDNKSNLCQSCYIQYMQEIKIEHWLKTGETGCLIGSHLKNCIREYIYKKQNYKCAICQCENVWNNKELKFVLDHIDGDASNNKEENLRLICPNCDSQLDTYKSKNKNSARNFRHKYYELNKDIA